MNPPPQENQPGEAAQDLVGPEPQAGGASSETAALIASITEYLSLGGLFNPEMMDHNAVRDLLINCRTQLDAERAKRLDAERELKIANAKNRSSLANNLCSDHRDKQQGKPCLACEIETLTRELLALRGGEGRKVSAGALAWIESNRDFYRGHKVEEYIDELLCVLSEEGGRQKEGGTEITSASKSSETST